LYKQELRSINVAIKQTDLYRSFFPPISQCDRVEYRVSNKSHDTIGIAENLQKTYRYSKNNCFESFDWYKYGLIIGVQS